MSEVDHGDKRKKNLERQYKQACLSYRKAMEDHEQVQLEYIRSQLTLDEAQKRKRAILSQLAGKIDDKLIGGSGAKPSSGISDTAPPPRTFKIGERMRKRFHGQYYEGTITALPEPERDYYHIFYDDGDEEDISVADMKRYIIEQEDSTKAKRNTSGMKREVACISSANPRPVDTIDTVQPSASHETDDSSMTDMDGMDRKVAALPRRKKPKSPPLEMLVTEANRTEICNTPKQREQHARGTASADATLSIVTEIHSPPSMLAKRVTNPATNLLSEFEAFLQLQMYVPSQVERIVSQIGKLVNGEGIEYHQWPEGVSFWKGKHLDSLETTLLDRLEREATKHEDRYGSDIYGFSLRIPVRELKSFVARRKK